MYFFFKQKTAYEMRISDWSSDVCSSDLDAVTGSGPRTPTREPLQYAPISVTTSWKSWPMSATARPASTSFLPHSQIHFLMPVAAMVWQLVCQLAFQRSEEHTSELQSLMRISYAVFCLKKKTTQQNKNNKTNKQHKKNSIIIYNT